MDTDTKYINVWKHGFLVVTNSDPIGHSIYCQEPDDIFVKTDIHVGFIGIILRDKMR